MICLDVERYCQQCLDFTPSVVKPEKISSTTGELIITDTVVQCQYRKRCASIERYLKQQMKGE